MKTCRLCYIRSHFSPFTGEGCECPCHAWAMQNVPTARTVEEWAAYDKAEAQMRLRLKDFEKLGE